MCLSNKAKKAIFFIRKTFISVLRDLSMEIYIFLIFNVVSAL